MFRIYLVTVILLISSIAVIESKEKVRFVSVVFRHGNRAPDNLQSELYPKDPNIDKSFYPVGRGGLTNNGKKKVYTLGQKLRDRYNDFLGDFYIPAEVEARSSDVERTKMSLQLVLAGLYPPNKAQRWNKLLNWQPTETEYVPKNADHLFFAPYSCPKYFEELLRVKLSTEVKNMVEKFGPSLKELTTKTGKQMKDVLDMWRLYHGLMAELAMHLKLPKWTAKYFPNGPLLEASNLVYKILSWNNLLKRLSGGVLLKRIIDDMKAVAENGATTETRKINLFSGHEHNVAALLNALGIYEPHVPQYSSAVIIELVQYKKVHYVKIIRYLGIPKQFVVVEIPNCNELCPLEKFIKLMEPVTPLDVESECKSDKISQSQLAGLIKNFVQP